MSLRHRSSLLIRTTASTARVVAGRRDGRCHPTATTHHAGRHSSIRPYARRGGGIIASGSGGTGSNDGPRYRSSTTAAGGRRRWKDVDILLPPGDDLKVFRLAVYVRPRGRRRACGYVHRVPGMSIADESTPGAIARAWVRRTRGRGEIDS